MINIGDQIPAHTFSVLQADGMVQVSTDDLFQQQTVVLFAVPGAFTPTCSEAHLPGYVVLADQFKAKGIDRIICLSVNDAFVMQAWGEAQNANEIDMLADGDGSFCQALGLAKDTGKFGGLRATRFAMVVTNGEITALEIEPPKAFQASSAEHMLTLV
ncbi:peroxiredoxin [Motilimonas pumila]|uniref:Glutathione-dependent peroxiredoxin n=1 Tax=Motilimonas pumila TaxID=2303987 RepID=A0A418YE71_9GAMM|nr:peroxiredoxin [Motilimonas pumila]RJG47455.1 peroxiredoxin [Motilimonas pumila]